ncbi:uncharacterized protein LOC119604091 isoform X2 [Lucilia sericata]|uniref:uncharacterized protein LOC119604091 isoform X2 n=1 Tax=Lucilia sericata TaxID=13632 RepID=UPI0018A852BF|nr:uncharacterized protein LOC119604091 isoform X2 [Lucilia sericata]
MWSKKINKLSVFLLLMVLVNVSLGETTLDPLTSVSGQNQELNGDAVIVENLNSIEGSGNAEDEVLLVTETANDLENPTESVTESANNAEDVQNTESIIETTTTTNRIECVCDCTAANGNQVTVGCSTQTPEVIITETTQQTEENTSSNNDSTLPNSETTKSDIEEETTETTSESNAEQTTDEPETTTPAAPPVCSTPGIQANELNCQQYNDCSLEGSLDGSFHLLTKSCPEKQAFNIELNRCSRDISSCSLPIQCLVKGGVADPTSNSSYYLCEPRLIGAGFRIFHIDCASHEIFYPELGKCFVDFNNLPTQDVPLFGWNQIRDIDIVKAELKLLKEQDKLQLKQEKERLKAEEKLQKELEKEAKKKAKEEEKINKEKAKLQAASIVCVQEGNYASEIAENIYYACITKKGKLKAIPMQCGFGATFNAETGTCINSLANLNASVSDNDDDDDD